MPYNVPVFISFWKELFFKVKHPMHVVFVGGFDIIVKILQHTRDIVWIKNEHFFLDKSA